MRSSVGCARRSAISARQRSKISGTSRPITVSTPSGFSSGSAAPSVVFISRAQIASSSGGIPMNDPITRETTGCATSVTRSHVSRPARPSSTPRRDRADLVLVLGDPLRREAGLEERLEAVVLRRVHPDEHRARELERQDRVGQRGDPAELGGVRLPVAADGVDVVGRRDRPVAGLLRGSRRFCAVQWTGHSARSRLNSSYGGPSCQCSGSPTRTSLRSRPVAVIGASCSRARVVGRWYWPAGQSALGGRDLRVRAYSD